MWKVKNNINARSVFKYNTRVIFPFFKLWINVSQLPDLPEKLAEDDFWETYIAANPIINKRFISNNKKGLPIKPLLQDIVLLGDAVIKSEWTKYRDQNRQVYNGNYNIPVSVHPEPIKKFFKDYLYEYYWGLRWVWEEVVSIDFNRGKFHDNFKTENKLTVCSYCDVDTIAASRNSSVEHFLPKDHFPLIACNPRNLIPCCTACNMESSGKGASFKSPIYSQFNREIGDDVHFKFTGTKISILPNQDPAIENYIELLKLRKRFKEPGVHNAVLNRFKTNYNLMSNGGVIDKVQFLKYVRQFGRDGGHYYVQSDLLNQASLIVLPHRV